MRTCRAVHLLAAFASFARASAAESAPESITLEPIEVTGKAIADAPGEPPLGARAIDESRLAPQRAAGRDTARLLEESPGVTSATAGAISSQPVVHGLADDRVRVQVDGVELTPACPNHMNSALSYIDPSKVGAVTVYAGITPVSVGGDSLGGSIQVRSAPPEFARPDPGYLVRAHLDSFYRSNGNAYGYDLGATGAIEWLNLTFSQSTSRSDNFRAGRGFKAATSSLRDDEVGSSAYRGATNRAVTLALRRGAHSLQVDLSQQHVDFEGFPNQRMDMTANDNKVGAARYRGQFDWGEVEGTLSYQNTQHRMDMGPDRFSYGLGMPMGAKAKTVAGTLRTDAFVSERHTLRAGLEYQRYVLYDWWPPVGGTMGPNTFWNIDFGRRQKIDSFVEWEANWTELLTSQIGLRSDVVTMDASAVQGYDNGLDGLWGLDAQAFNAQSHRHVDVNWDFASIVRYAPAANVTLEGGYARKVRSPNVHQRFPWATNAMAALMNNLVGDGNGYVGNLALRRETAHTLSLTGRSRDATGQRWELEVTGHATVIQDYIDARRCTFGQCSAANVTAENSFTILEYANRNAEIAGADVSGWVELLSAVRYGSLRAKVIASYLHGGILSTGDGLYNLMPPNAKLSVSYRMGAWSAAPEVVAVAAKTDVSSVRNEVRTGAYGLLNLRGAYAWKHARVDLAVENVFNAFYSLPLGGAYVGQGPSMTTNGIAWGTAMPGPGRSCNVALSLFF